VDWQCPFQEIPVGKGRKLHDGTQLAILTIGPLGVRVRKLIETHELNIAHYDMRFLKPIDTEILHEVGERFSKIITLEDGVIKGGLGSEVLEYMNDHGYHPDIIRLGLPDSFIEHGTPAELHHLVGIDEEGILRAIQKLIYNKE
jgi:1-deoxy-D-xylulose-5-phosphate synthase